ncbi:hypothetical protein HNQ99_000464 [Rhizorhapis suberifaciens]|uniref:Uncharacterized protein n=1 Tax=Rhizorhapis suberifaciens TaxID=13656 RepID=A0A840HRJ7_9SPHN|nr:hypothetical protein [Rhizorhapis suberifaciens]
MLLGRRIVAVDAAKHNVTSNDGLVVGYGSLRIARKTAMA